MIANRVGYEDFTASQSKSKKKSQKTSLNHFSIFLRKNMTCDNYAALEANQITRKLFGEFVTYIVYDSGVKSVNTAVNYISQVKCWIERQFRDANARSIFEGDDWYSKDVQSKVTKHFQSLEHRPKARIVAGTIRDGLGRATIGRATIGGATITDMHEEDEKFREKSMQVHHLQKMCEELFMKGGGEGKENLLMYRALMTLNWSCIGKVIILISF